MPEAKCIACDDSLYSISIRYWWEMALHRIFNTERRRVRRGYLNVSYCFNNEKEREKYIGMYVSTYNNNNLIS